MLMLRNVRFVALTLLAALLFAPPSFAESFDTRHLRDFATNPRDLHFRLETTFGNRAFHRGERIPLTLQFSSDALNKYKLNGATYDRSGRLPTEQFLSDREVPDPYQDYFGTGVIGGLAGGLRGYPVLESQPQRIELDLNDWFRFDVPGRYRFYLKSHRLSRERQPGEVGEKTIAFAAVSNILELEILPDDPEWSRAKLAEIRTVLSRTELAPEPGHGPSPRTLFVDDIALARRELRYLATDDAVRFSLEEAAKLGQAPDTLLLIGARDRSKTIAAFDKYLAHPHVSLDAWQIRVRALFRLLQKEESQPLPLLPWQLPESHSFEQSRQTALARQSQFDEVVRQEAVRLIPVAAGKESEPRKISGKAIASIAPDAAEAAGLVPPYDYGLPRGERIAEFPRFDAERQSELLTAKWDLIRGPEMIPVLRNLVEKAKPRSLPKFSMPLTVWGVDAGIEQAALRRLMELSPAEAADILRADIASGEPTFARFEVLEFPAQAIPEADAALSALLATSRLVALPLIARYATVRLSEQMRQLYVGQSWACEEEEAFLTYFIRTMPGDEEGGGNDLLKRAMTNRKNRGCFRSLLHGIANVVWNTALQTQAIATLDDPDPEACESAARVLSSHGDATVEEFLWKRLERWSENWKGRAEELKVHPITGELPNQESRLGSALFDAIATARSWVLDESRRQRLAARCVDEGCNAMWGPKPRLDTIPVEASNGGWLYPKSFRVDGYSATTLDALKRKLQLYPAGTNFRWCPQAWNPSDAFSPGQRDDMHQELTAFLSKHSMRIEPYVEQECAPGIAAK